MQQAKAPQPVPAAVTPWRQRVLRHPAVHLLCSVGILLLDLVTGPFLQFPILFVFPVASSAWYVGPRLGYSLAVALPVGRLVIAWMIDLPSPAVYMAVNCLIRIGVLVFVAFLVRRIVHYAQTVEGRLNDLVTICAWSRTVEYEGEWLSFEEYLRRRFEVNVTHGISPDASTVLRQSRDVLRQTPTPAKMPPDISSGNPT